MLDSSEKDISVQLNFQKQSNLITQQKFEEGKGKWQKSKRHNTVYNCK